MKKYNNKQKKLLEINDTLEIKIAQEIEKNRQKDIKIFQQAKLASMGEMIANIAHQWRQPLSAISGIASGISVQNTLGIFDNTKLNELMDKVVSSTQYLSQTIEDFRNFFKEDKERQKVQISKVIDTTLSIIGDSLKHENIIAIVDLQEDKVINTFVNELEQALLNIIKNSKDALIDERNISLDEKYIFITLQIEDENVRIEIKDNAGGIPPSIIDKIFDPYFTTKHQSQGTGIGLYMTEEIVVKHLNGKLDVYNCTYEYKEEKYTGASFLLNIPLST
jgi:signal transduction histidine kinase